MANPIVKVRIGPREGLILATDLGVGFQFFRLLPGAQAANKLPLVEKFAGIKGPRLRQDNLYFILAEGRHFSILAEREEEEVAQYVGTTKRATQYVETGEYCGKTGETLLVPRDGDALLCCIYYLKTDGFPKADMAATLRAGIAKKLSQEALREGLIDLVTDLLDNAAERPFEQGCFKTWGPRTSALLAADPGFMAARERALASQSASQAGAQAASAESLDSGGPAQAKGPTRADKKARRKGEAKRKAKGGPNLEAQAPLPGAQEVAAAALAVPVAGPDQGAVVAERLEPQPVQEHSDLLASIEWALANECDLEPLQNLLATLQNLVASLAPSPENQALTEANQALAGRIQSFASRRLALEASAQAAPLAVLEDLEAQLQALNVEILLFQAKEDERFTQASLAAAQGAVLVQAFCQPVEAPAPVGLPELNGQPEPAAMRVALPGLIDSREDAQVQVIQVVPQTVKMVVLQKLDFCSESATADFLQALSRCHAAESVFLSCNQLYGQTDRFLDALHGLSELSCLGVMGQALDTGIMPSLRAFLGQNHQLRGLSLRNNQLNLQNLDELCMALLQQNHPLPYLDFALNPVGYGDTTLWVERLLGSSPSLRTIYLDRCGLGDDYASRFLLAIGNNPVLEELSMAGNGISDEGGTVLAALLGRNKHLKSLDLSMNLLGESSLGDLLKAVERHPALRWVRVLGMDPISLTYQEQINQVLAAR